MWATDSGDCVRVRGNVRNERRQARREREREAIELLIRHTIGTALSLPPDQAECI